MTTTIVDRDWKVLLDGLERGNCAVLLGPDLPVALGNDDPAPISTTLSRSLAEVLESEERITVRNPEDLPLVAQEFLDRKSRADLEAEIATFYDDLDEQLANNNASNPVFETLASLPFSVYITSRHDRTLEHFLRQHERAPVMKRFDFRGSQQLSVGAAGTIEAPLVYEMFGSVDSPASLAVTENDLLDLLEAIVAGNPGLPNDLRNEFHEKSFLFLGWGLERYYIRVLLHALGLNRSAQRSFAVEDSRDDLANCVWFYSVGYKRLKMLDVDPLPFLDELRQRWDTKHPNGSWAGPVVNGTSLSPVDPPKVFVSYVGEDRPVAEQVVTRLRDEGLDPWFDRESVIIGDDWKRLMDRAIDKDADFFVVLLSEHFGDGVDSYVHHEIARALDRRLRRGALKFIYPLRIDDQASIPRSIEEANIQAPLLTSLDADLSTLATDIKREFAKLRRR